MAEILAPVGGPEQLYAAVRCGADAVYLGTKAFNARRNASNFDYDELTEAVKYCHVRDVSVYTTVNTLIFDDELKGLEEAAENIAASGIDGVIIQDLAVLNIFKKRYPNISRIASTQMAVHNVEGAKMIQELGFDTLVLARELSKQEIIDILKNIDIKTEIFIHGAHCMSLSGACYVSSMLGGRSGNRGLCAQPCRLNWKSRDMEYALSLKDLSLISYLKELEEIGVDSFKIEGRMKRPEYVAAVVTACKKALNGEEYDLNQLEAVFSRSGFTDGYYKGKRSRDMFGIRTKDDVISSSSVMKEIAQTFSKEKALIPVTVSVNIDDSASVFTIEDNRGNRIVKTGKGGETAINKVTTSKDVEKNSVKFGGTPYFADNLNVSIQNGLYYPLSELNSIRRNAIEALTAAREYNNNIKWNGDAEFIEETPEHKSLKKEKWGRFYKDYQITDTDYFDKYIIPIDVIENNERLVLDPAKVIVELPAVIFPEDEHKNKESLRNIKDRGYCSVYANNIYGIKLAQELGLDIHGGFGLNATNSVAFESYSSLGLKSLSVSFETDSNRINDINHSMPLSLVVYGRLPLMRYRACPIRVSVGCNECQGEGEIKDRYGNTFPVECWKKKVSSLLNSVPLYIGDKSIPEAEITVYWFTNEDQNDIKHVIDCFRGHMKPDFDRTTGLYYREVL